MKKLKIKVVEENKVKRIVVNSKMDKESFCYPHSKSCRLYDADVINELISYSFGEITQFFYRVEYDRELENWDFWVNIELIKRIIGHNPPSIRIALVLESEEWKKPYSISEFSKTLSQSIEVVSQNKFHYFQLDEFLSNGFGIDFPLENVQSKVCDEEIKIIKITEEILKKTHQTLLANLDKDLLISYFTFPEEIKAACKQYLVYFAQFLMDLGIEADTEIKEEAQQTLFKVIPKNKDESLDKIREALDVYLNIPNDFDIQVAQNQDVAVMQWQANVMHLKSQLTLANSVLQMKDATIESLQLSNYQLKEMLGNKSTSKEPKNEEELVKGIVKVKEYDGKGFSINFPEILRKLKRGFGKR